MTLFDPHSFEQERPASGTARIEAGLRDALRAHSELETEQAAGMINPRVRGTEALTSPLDEEAQEALSWTKDELLDKWDRGEPAMVMGLTTQPPTRVGTGPTPYPAMTQMQLPLWEPYWWQTKAVN